jgi:Concanavalin A-like lectin/glucanases superfamily
MKAKNFNRPVNAAMRMAPVKSTCTAALLAVGLAVVATTPANASLQFDGSTSKAVLDGSYLDGTTHSAYTFEAWIKPSILGGTLIGKTEFWKEWTLDTEPDGGIMLRGAWPNYYWGQETAAGSITTNVWQYVCCAVTDGLASFYVNGSLVGTETVHDPIDFAASTGGGSSFDGTMSIGYTDSGTTPDYNFFNGLICGIRVWNRTLSASDVHAIYTLGVPPSTNGLYNAVMLDEPSGSTIEDARTSLTGRNLTAVWSSDTPPMSQADLSFTNSTPVASYFIDLSRYNDFKTPVLSSQSNYCFRATGRGGVGPLDRGDAMADAAFYPSFHPLTAKWAAPENTWTWVGHSPFRPTPDVFNPAHVYYFYLHGNDTSEELTFADNPYSDNVGGFSVDLFAIPAGGVPPQSQSFLTNGLVAYYPFNGNADDASGNGHNGTVNGPVLTADRFGNPNRAYYFNGISDYITTPLGNTVFGGDFTASVWFNPYGIANGWPTLLEAQDNNVNYALFLDIAGTASGVGSAEIGWLGAGSTYASASWGWGLNTGRAVPLNTYSQVIITKAGTNVTMYLNGQTASTGTVTHAIPTSGQFVTIGRADVSTYAGDWAFRGVLDDIRIYDRALSASEVQELYQYESTPPAPPARTPRAALATAAIMNGFVVGATVTDAGCGYTNTPLVRIIGGHGSGAQAVAVITNGEVVAVNVLEAGSGYTNAPVVVIEPPFIPQPTMAAKGLVFGPMVTPVVELNLANLSPYDTYQLEFTPVAGGAWTNLGEPFIPTATTNTQYVNTIGNTGFLRVKYAP